MTGGRLEVDLEKLNDWRRLHVYMTNGSLCNCPMHEWHQSLHGFSYLVLFICNLYMLLCSV